MIIKIIAIVLVAFIVFNLIVTYIVFHNTLIIPKHLKPWEGNDCVTRFNENNAKDKKFFLELGYEEKVIYNKKVKLIGYYFNNNNSNKTAILCHGYTANPFGMSIPGRIYYEQGYNVLLIAQRAHHISGGRWCTMSYQEKYDLLKWIDLLVKDNPKVGIICQGVSMGGATVSGISGLDIPSNVKGIVCDCGFSSIYDQFASRLTKLGFYKSVFLFFINIWAHLLGHFSIYKETNKSIVAKATVPMLFIHGDSDTFVPTSMGELMYKECGSKEKYLYIAKDSVHATNEVAEPEVYKEKIVSFANSVIK